MQLPAGCGDLIVRNTPTRAPICGFCLRADHGEPVPGFAAFMRDAVARYSQHPYSVKYWEIYNEPDVVRNSEPIPYGC
jgi:hypothetical protein